jgi:hypothetical protein
LIPVVEEVHQWRQTAIVNPGADATEAFDTLILHCVRVLDAHAGRVPALTWAQPGAHREFSLHAQVQTFLRRYGFPFWFETRN